MAQQTDPKAELASRFEALAASVSQAEVVKSPEPIDEAGSGYRFSKATELHIEFQVGATRLLNQVDASALFPVKVTGYQRVFDSRKHAQPVTERGSDLQRIMVTVEGLLADEGTPKAKIRPFELKHGTDYDAVQLARDAIIDRVRWYLPDVEIEGRQKFLQKTLSIQNATDEPIWVFAHVRRRIRDEKTYEWNWLPGDPGSAKPYRMRVDPKTTQQFEIELLKGRQIDLPSVGGIGGGDINLPDVNQPLIGNRVRVWAESESGQRWEEYRSKDLWLVEPNPKLDGQRVYHDLKRQTFTYRIDPKTGSRSFNERLLVLKNDTPETLRVDLQYRARENGLLRWRKVKTLQIPPGVVAGPLTGQQMRVRASQIRFVARGEDLYFNRYGNESLHLVEKGEAGRVYLAEKIGEYVHVLQTKDAQSKTDDEDGR